MLEVFAGTARLTRSVRDAGLGAMAIDKDRSRRAQSVHVAQYDLNVPDQLQALCDFTKVGAHGMGIKVSKPLRSDHQPGGIGFE